MAGVGRGRHDRAAPAAQRQRRRRAPRLPRRAGRERRPLPARFPDPDSLRPMVRMVKAAEMLDLVDTPQRLVVLTPLGQRFAAAPPVDQHRLWREGLLQLRLFKVTQRAHGSPRRRAVEEGSAAGDLEPPSHRRPRGDVRHARRLGSLRRLVQLLRRPRAGSLPAKRSTPSRRGVLGLAASTSRSLSRVRPGRVSTRFHVFDWPKDGRLVVAGLASQPRRAYLLRDASRTALPLRREEDAQARVSCSAAPRRVRRSGSCGGTSPAGPSGSGPGSPPRAGGRRS